MLYMKGVGERIGDSAHLGDSKNANSNGPMTGEKIETNLQYHATDLKGLPDQHGRESI